MLFVKKMYRLCKKWHKGKGDDKMWLTKKQNQRGCEKEENHMKKRNLVRKVSSMAVSTAMIMSLLGTGSVPAMAAAMTADDCYAEGYDVNVQLEAEGAVLLKNSENCLPLAEGTKVTLLGAMSYNYVEGGTGSGSVK